jgi:two-component system OmpR family sensor kinase
MSLRARLLIVAVALVAAGLLATGVVTYGVFSRFLTHRVDEQLELARPIATFALGNGPDPEGHPEAPGVPSGTYAEFISTSGRVFGPKFLGPETYSPAVIPDEVLSGSTSTIFTASSEDGSIDYRVSATPAESTTAGTGTLIVAIPLTEVNAALHRLVIVEGIVATVVLLLVVAFALWLVPAALRPLDGIGATAGAIAAGDLSRRVEPADERTEIGRLGIALNTMLAQIEVAFEERRASESRLRRFIADASHELRTPLTSIRGYAELFRRGANNRPEDLAKSMARIEAEAARMGILVDDLLLLARLDQGRPLQREPVDLVRIVAESVDAAQVIEPGRRILLDAPATLPALGDAGRLRQVVDNLLDNVRVHTAPGAPAHIRLWVDGELSILEVADEGDGMTPEVAERIFERFFRGDPARSRETGGAGLGLSIVVAIIEAHGGTVEVGTRPEGGSVFTVRIPLPATPEPTPTPDHVGSKPDVEVPVRADLADDATA